MVKVLRGIERGLIVLGLSLFAWLIYVHLRYWDVMPQAPDPTTGRVYAFRAIRFLVYVTKQEADRGRLAETMGSLGIVGVMITVPLLRWVGRRSEPSSGNRAEGSKTLE